MQHDDGGWGWWKTDGNHPFMTAYALWGLDEARRAGVKVDGYRIDNGARALAKMYATYPRAEPDLKVYRPTCCGAACRRATRSSRTARADRCTYRHADAREEVWNARARMSAYGRALLLLLLDEAKDPRGNELAQAPDRRGADARRPVVVGGREGRSCCSTPSTPASRRRRSRCRRWRAAIRRTR